MIHKNIHFIWFGDYKPEFDETIEAYKKMNPDFTVNFIYEPKLFESRNRDVLECFRKLQDKQGFYYNFLYRIGLQSYERKLHPAKSKERFFMAMFSDVLRIHLIDKYGGIYVDLDTMPKKPFDDEILAHNSFIVRVKSFNNVIKRFVTGIDCFFMGCEPGYISKIVNVLVPSRKNDWKELFSEKYGTYMLPPMLESKDDTINPYITHFFDKQWTK